MSYNSLTSSKLPKDESQKPDHDSLPPFLEPTGRCKSRLLTATLIPLQRPLYTTPCAPRPSSPVKISTPLSVATAAAAGLPPPPRSALAS
ncbi:hypothetical protein Vretifemale_929, partial [Volvox reticuliferus]